MPGQAGINAARRGQPHRQPMHPDKVGERIQSRLDHDGAESGGQLANGRQLIGSCPSAAGREQPYHPGLIGDGHRPVPALHRVISLAPGQRGLAQLQRRLAGQTGGAAAAEERELAPADQPVRQRRRHRARRRPGPGRGPPPAERAAAPSPSWTASLAAAACKSGRSRTAGRTRRSSRAPSPSTPATCSPAGAATGGSPTSTASCRRRPRHQRRTWSRSSTSTKPTTTRSSRRCSRQSASRTTTRRSSRPRS